MNQIIDSRIKLVIFNLLWRLCSNLTFSLLTQFAEISFNASHLLAMSCTFARALLIKSRQPDSTRNYQFNNCRLTFSTSARELPSTKMTNYRHFLSRELNTGWLHFGQVHGHPASSESRPITTHGSQLVEENSQLSIYEQTVLVTTSPGLLLFSDANWRSPKSRPPNVFFFFEFVHTTVVGGLTVMDTKFRNTVDSGGFVVIYYDYIRNISKLTRKISKSPFFKCCWLTVTWRKNNTKPYVPRRDCSLHYLDEVRSPHTQRVPKQFDRWLIRTKYDLIWQAGWSVRMASKRKKN